MRITAGRLPKSCAYSSGKEPSLCSLLEMDGAWSCGRRLTRAVRVTLSTANVSTRRPLFSLSSIHFHQCFSFSLSPLAALLTPLLPRRRYGDDGVGLIGWGHGTHQLIYRARGYRVANSRKRKSENALDPGRPKPRPSSGPGWAIPIYFCLEIYVTTTTTTLTAFLSFFRYF